jgi:hypothetical protein
MTISAATWEHKRRQGLFRYLLIDGVMFMGGPFALVMQVLGYFLFPENAETFGQYFASSTTWLHFILHGSLFGVVMGLIKWRRYSSAYSDGSKQV